MQVLFHFGGGLWWINIFFSIWSITVKQGVTNHWGNKCHSRIKALSYELDKLSETQDAIYDARDASIEAEK